MIVQKKKEKKRQVFLKLFTGLSRTASFSLASAGAEANASLPRLPQEARRFYCDGPIEMMS